jgi:hypothetical protein
MKERTRTTSIPGSSPTIHRAMAAHDKLEVRYALISNLLVCKMLIQLCRRYARIRAPPP